MFYCYQYITVVHFVAKVGTLCGESWYTFWRGSVRFCRRELVQFILLLTVSEKQKNKTTTTVPETTKSLKQVEKEYKSSCETITFKTLSRNPDKYKGYKYKFRGQVEQVLDSDSWFDDSTTLRISVTPEKNQFADGGVLWSDTMVASVNIPEGDDRILEGDIITFCGECDGLYTYESLLGQKISVPKINIKYFVTAQ